MDSTNGIELSKNGGEGRSVKVNSVFALSPGYMGGVTREVEWIGLAGGGI